MAPANPITSRTKDYYLTLRSRFIPEAAKIIFVLESPPASGKYFYNPNGSTNEPLFQALMNDVLGINPCTKEQGLTQFAANGYFLIDSTYIPVNGLDDNEAAAIIERDFDLLVRDLKEHV